MSSQSLSTAIDNKREEDSIPLDDHTFSDSISHVSETTDSSDNVSLS